MARKQENLLDRNHKKVGIRDIFEQSDKGEAPRMIDWTSKKHIHP